MVALGTAVLTMLLGACSEERPGCSVVACVPVYGQSLALGEEAQLITDLNNLSSQYDMRVVGEGLDADFGFYDCDGIKRWVKRTVGYNHRLYECSAYAMGATLAQALGRDTMVCVFAGGQGATPISGLIKGTAPYRRFVDDIQKSCSEARDRGMTFYVPAVCWLQGESDMVDNTGVNYQSILAAWAADIDEDIRRITGQTDTVRVVCYQSGSMALASDFDNKEYISRVGEVAQAQMELVRDNPRFVAGMPVYPLSFYNDRLHLDGHGQQDMGKANGKAALQIIRNNGRHVTTGLVPYSLCAEGDSIIITLSTCGKPLCIDTTTVEKVANYGLAVITPTGNDICQNVTTAGEEIIIKCNANTRGCRVRYAINGTPGKSGRKLGARGNIRTDDGRWCYAFDMPVE